MPQFLTLCSQNDDLDFLHSDVQYLSSSGPTVQPGLESGQTTIAIIHTRPPSPSPALACHHYRPHLHIVQSKIIALLVPPTCTNGPKTGSTQWAAKYMYMWVWLTHSKLDSQIRNMGY